MKALWFGIALLAIGLGLGCSEDDAVRPDATTALTTDPVNARPHGSDVFPGG